MNPIDPHEREALILIQLQGTRDEGTATRKLIHE